MAWCSISTFVSFSYRKVNFSYLWNWIFSNSILELRAIIA
jgi:hypothetical protein